MNTETNKLHISGGRHYEIKEVKAADIDINNRNSAHSLLVGLIGDDSVVLDVGCSYGYLGEWLVKNKNCTVCGIEVDRIAAHRVRSEEFYRDVFEIDLDYCEKNPGEFKRFKNLDIQFDYIICADVIEHLKDPTTVLAVVSEKLKEAGKILISIPNIANIDVALNLIEGRFNYSQVGILDSTHLRFFTKSSFMEWMQSINSSILKEYSFDVGLAGSTKTLSEFAGYVKTNYPDTYNILTNTMGEDADVLQYIFVLTKNKRRPEDNSGNKSFETEPKHLQHIEERLHELTWALECASRIFKKKQETSSGYLRKLLASERTAAELEEKLKEKDAILQKLLGLACRITPVDIKRRPPIIAEKISVIIPVKNGGEQLSALLGMIRSQRKVQDVEIIVIDSESTDNSVPIAKDFGARVIRIPQREFNHGRTRNLGVAESSGDYLVFTVQDAIPINNYWFYNMICPFIEYPELAALSCKQFIKPEADLFSLWMNSQIPPFDRDVIYSLSGDLKGIDWRFFDSATKRRLTFFDNVSSCIRRGVLKEIEFSSLINAEDIDFGIKLLETRRPIGYLTSTGVYHWHERGADYVFKRHYIGTKANIYILKNNLPRFFGNNNLDWECLTANIAGMYNLINISIADLAGIDSGLVAAIRTFINNLKRNIDFSPEKIDGMKESRIQGDNGLDALLRQVIGDNVFTPEQLYNFKQNFLIQDFMNNIGQFTEHICGKHQTLKGREKDLVACIYRIFSITAGEAVGAYYIEAETLNRLSPDLRRMDRLLGRGVCYF